MGAEPGVGLSGTCGSHPTWDFLWLCGWSFVCVAHGAVCLQKKEVTATVREEQYTGFEVLGEVGISQIGELDACIRKVSSVSVSWNLLSSYLWVPWSEQRFKPSKLLCKEDQPSQDQDSSRQRREFFTPSQQ